MATPDKIKQWNYLKVIASDIHRLWYQSWPFDWCKLCEGIRVIEVISKVKMVALMLIRQG